MKLIVNTHDIRIEKELVNELEVNVTKVTFEFNEQIPTNYVKKAFFSNDVASIEILLTNNECNIPNEVLTKIGQVRVGVIAYEIQNDELIERFNPSPAYFLVKEGSLIEADNTEPISPTDKEQIEQAIASLEVNKQDNLTAGDNITIENNVISAADTIYDDTEVKADISNLEANKADKTEIPDVSSFITKNVNDLTYYTLGTATGSSIDMSIDSSTYVLAISLKNSSGTVLNTKTVDLPLETMVVNGSYNNTSKRIILMLESGNTIEIPVGDLISGLQSEITSSNKLSSDLVDDTNNTNKFVTQSDRTNWNNKVTDSNYVHTDNNYTNEEKTKLNSIENNAETNIIETIKFNGTSLTPDENKTVSITALTTSDIDNTLTESGKVADARATGQAIANIVGEDVSENVIYTQLSHFDNIYGGYNATASGLSANSQYNSYGLTITNNTNLYFNSHNTGYVALCVYDNTSFQNGTRYRYYPSGSENNLPYEANPMSLTTGKYIVVCVKKNNPAFSMTITRVINGVKFNQNINLAQKQIQQVISAEKSIKLQYDATVSGNDFERLNIYTPTAVGYIRWNFAHFRNTNINSDCWLIHPLYAVTDELVDRYAITVSGEFECAIKIDGAPDFMGGSTHGSEIVNTLNVYIDGAKVDPTTLLSMTSCKEVRVITQSNLYDPRDETTLVAIHGKEYVWRDDKLIIYQTISWEEAETITNSYLAMFPISKSVSDYISPNDTYETHAFTDGYITRSGIDSIVTWSETVGLLARFSIPRWDIKGTALTGVGSFASTDNGGNNYNKMYYLCAISGSVSSGNKWKTMTEYQIEINK